MIEFPCGLAGEIHITRADIDAVGGERKMRDNLERAMSEKAIVEGTEMSFMFGPQFGGVTVTWYPSVDVALENYNRKVIRI